MSDSPDSLIRGHVGLADFVNVDSGGKLNVLGGNLAFIGLQPGQGATAAFAVYATLISPAETSDPVAVELLLVDASGDPVMLPGPSGELQAMRVSQLVQFQSPQIVGISVPRGAVEASAQMILNFPGGLALALGQSYTWRIQVDSEIIAKASFYIPQPPPVAVIG